ncbi:hypothetical protein NJ7G_1062 [Natrinema sp. J7-2]|nr:hypothetical protein NJ7G_1062 [Natrinema sp. J7-2]
MLPYGNDYGRNGDKITHAHSESDDRPWITLGYPFAAAIANDCGP